MKKKTPIQIVARLMLALLLGVLPLLAPAPVSAAVLVFTEGQFVGEIITMVPTWYLRQLRSNTTNDSLLWSDLSAAEKTQVTTELAYRVAGTSRLVETAVSGAGEAGSGAANGTAGAAITTTSGAGGTTGTGVGGASGAVTLASGAGGVATGAGTGGAGGAVAVTGGVGGGTTTATGGAGADVTVTGGAGGAASGAGTGGAGGTITLAAGAGGGTSGGTAGVAGMVVIGGTNPVPVGFNLLRSTIANAGTISAAQMRGGVLFQDASAGVVTMTTRTGTLISGDYPDLAVGNALVIYLASNHATNTSTIAGGTDVTLVGSGAVTQTGGTFLLIKTAATTYDLVRVG